MSCNNVNIEDFQLGVASGDLSPSYKQVYKFGQNADVGIVLKQFGFKEVCMPILLVQQP